MLELSSGDRHSSNESGEVNSSRKRTESTFTSGACDKRLKWNQPAPTIYTRFATLATRSVSITIVMLMLSTRACYARSAAPANERDLMARRRAEFLYRRQGVFAKAW